MITARGLVRSLTGWLGKPMASADSDPQRFFGTMYALPNPDPILRNMGAAEQVYFSIMADAHVIGDVRSIRGNFRSYDWRLNVGNDGDPLSAKAMELCEKWMRETPPGGTDGNGIQNDWTEVMWQMTSSIFTGYRVHESPYHLTGGKLLPMQVIDRPSRRFKFDAHGSPLLISTGNMIGAPIEQPSQFVISRHMADTVNPYGVALLSSCFWPWTFKTGGWRYFVKYCERHGLPWPVGRYPTGSLNEDIELLSTALANMVEAGYVVAPEGTGLELLTPQTGAAGVLPQQNLIDLCNREMSKALTSQAMVSELQGVGARAASETAATRQNSVNDSDRDIAVASMGQIFKWITLYNFGDGVAPPEIEFFQEDHGDLSRAQSYQIVANMGARPSRKAFLEEMGMPEAEDDADALMPAAPPAAGSADQPPKGKKPGSPLALVNMAGLAGFEFARAAGMTDDEALKLATDAADQAIEDQMIAPVAAMLARYEADGKTLAEFHADLQRIVGVMEDDALREVIDRSLSYSILRGAATQAA